MVGRGETRVKRDSCPLRYWLNRFVPVNVRRLEDHLETELEYLTLNSVRRNVGIQTKASSTDVRASVGNHTRLLDSSFSARRLRTCCHY